MRGIYDPRTDTLSIVFKPNVPIAESNEDQPGAILDCDKDGTQVSLEILDASERVDNIRRIEFRRA